MWWVCDPIMNRGGAHPSKQCRIKLVRGGGESTSNNKKKKKKKEEEKKLTTNKQTNKQKKHPLRHRERGARSICYKMSSMWSSMWWVCDPIMNRGGGAHPSKQCRIKLVRGGGGEIDRQQKRRKKRRKKQTNKQKKHPLRHRERGARSICYKMSSMWLSMWWVCDPIMNRGAPIHPSSAGLS